VLRKALAIVLALAVLALGVNWLVGVLESDETKIRRMLASMEDAYNRGDPGDCVAPLARDWRHAGTELDRQLLLGALFQVARERDRETKVLKTRVAVDEDAATVAIDGASATLACEAVFSRLRAGEWTETWRMRAEAELVDGDDGWEIVRSRHEDEAGTHLGR